MMPPKIAYILDTFPSVSETFVLNEVLELERRGLKITIYALNQPDTTIKHPALERLQAKVLYARERTRSGPHYVWSALTLFARKPAAFFKTLLMARALSHHYPWIAKSSIPLAKEILIDGCDRIHAHFAGPASQWAMMVSSLLSIPYTFTAHGSDIFLRPPEGFKSLVDNAEYCVTVTQYNKQYMVSKLGVLSEKIIIVPCGIDTDYFCPSTSDEHENGLVLCVARLSPEKNVQILVEVTKYLMSHGVQFVIKVIGDGPERAHIEALIEENRLADHFVLLGGKTTEDVLAYLRKAQVFILPSLSEGMGVSYLEAMSTMIPVIGTDINGIKEVVLDQQTGYLVSANAPDQLANRILYLLARPDVRVRMGVIGRRHVIASYTLKAQGSLMAEIFGLKDNAARA